jgi:hypothetical protein
MKRNGFVLAVFTILALTYSFAFADCEAECNGPFQTCLNICRHTTKEDSKEASNCVNSGFVAGGTNIAMAASCIEKGLQCTLNGTPCCSPYDCKGKFPNTYCQ